MSSSTRGKTVGVDKLNGTRAVGTVYAAVFFVEANS